MEVFLTIWQSCDLWDDGPKKGPNKWANKKWGKKKPYATAKKTTDNWLMQQNVALKAKVVFTALSVLQHRPKTKSFKTLLKIACLRMLLREENFFCICVIDFDFDGNLRVGQEQELSEKLTGQTKHKKEEN